MATITGLKADRILQMESDLELAVAALDTRTDTLEGSTTSLGTRVDTLEANTSSPAATDYFEEEFNTLANYTIVENSATVKIHDGAVQPTTRRGPKRLRRNNFSSSDLVQMVEIRPVYSGSSPAYGVQLNIGQYLNANNDLMGYFDINYLGQVAMGVQQRLAGAYSYGTHPATAGLPTDQWINGDPLWAVYRKKGLRLRFEIWTHDPRLGGSPHLVAHKRVDAAFENAVMIPEIWLYPNSSPSDDTAVPDGTGTRIFWHYARKMAVRPVGWF